MASGDDFFNDLFKQSYNEAFEYINQDFLVKDGRFSEMTIEGLKRFEDRYDGARKELKKRNSPLWKTLNE